MESDSAKPPVHPFIIDYAQRARGTKPTIRRHGDTVEITLAPLPPVTQRVIGAVAQNAERRLTIRGDMMQHPGGVFRTPGISFSIERSRGMLGLTELVATPPRDPEAVARRNRRSGHSLLGILMENVLEEYDLERWEQPFVLLYGTEQDNFQWLLRALQRIVVREARRAINTNASNQE